MPVMSEHVATICGRIETYQQQRSRQRRSEHEESAGLAASSPASAHNRFIFPSAPRGWHGRCYSSPRQASERVSSGLRTGRRDHSTCLGDC
jgi:hypothetical protein